MHDGNHTSFWGMLSRPLGSEFQILDTGFSETPDSGSLKGSRENPGQVGFGSEWAFLKKFRASKRGNQHGSGVFDKKALKAPFCRLVLKNLFGGFLKRCF